MGLMAYASSIVMSEMGGELLGTYICQDITVPGILSGDEEEMFIKESVIYRGFQGARGKGSDKFNES